MWDKLFVDRNSDLIFENFWTPYKQNISDIGV